MRHICLFLALFLLSAPCFSQENTSQINLDLHIRIAAIEEGGKDTLWLSLNGGTNLGLKKGMMGIAVQVYKSKERDYKNLTTAWIDNITNTTARAYLLTKLSKKDLLLEGDQVVFSDLSFKKHPSPDNELLRLLAAHNIQFIDVYAMPFYTQHELLQSATPPVLDSLMTRFKKDVVETAELLEEEATKPKSWTDPFTEGKFKGLSLIEAMKKTSLLDVESFLYFVKEYPGKYIGHKWKFNETYATWVINDMPMPTDKKYIVDAFAGLPASQTAAWYNSNQFYYDTVKHYLQQQADQYITDKKYDSASWLLTKATQLSALAKDDKFLSSIYTSNGLIVQNTGKGDNHAVVLALYDKAVQLDTLNWAPYWYRGNLYAEMEQYANAIKDFKVLNRMYPNYDNAWGNQGWWYLKQFKVKEAGPACLRAYELDSSNYAWSVNLAHYYILSGQNTKARQLYQKTLDNLKTEGEFNNGPLWDFDFFAERGVLTDVFAREKAWMLQQFNDVYKHYLRADSLFLLAKEMRTKGNFAAAVLHFEQSRAAELAAAKKRSLSIHNITTWIGYMHQQLKDYKKGEDFYTEALAVAEKDFHQQIPNDLELLSELYQKWGNKALAEAYESRALAWKRKTAEMATTNDLYIVSIGVDEYGDRTYQYAAADARKIAEEFKTKGKHFQNVYTHILTNKKAISDSVDKTVQKVIANAKEDDTFIFYFTGKAVNTETESFLLPSGVDVEENDTLLYKKAISPQLLRSWSNSINAKRQLFLLDASASQFSSAFANQSASLSKNISQKDLVIICATFPRIERPDHKSSLIAASIQKLFSDSVLSNEKTVTGKRIENFFAEELTRNNYYLSLESFSQGRDFVLAQAEAQVQTRSTPVPKQEVNYTARGITVENVSQSAGYKVNKRYGLFIATDIYSDPKWPNLNNPISDARDLKKALEEEYGFEIEVLPNPSKQQIFNKIDEYSKKQFDKNDQLVILFAGHGYFDHRRNEGYLVPSDGSYTEVEFDRYYYPMSSIMRDLKIIPANHMMVLVDACHGGAICDNALMRGEGDLYSALSVDQLLKNHLEFPNRLILTSGRKDQRVPDGVKGKNSPFIAAILTALRSREAKEKGMISYFQLMKYISEVQKTQATSAIFSPNDNWNFMFFYGGNKKQTPIGDPTGVVKQ